MHILPLHLRYSSATSLCYPTSTILQTVSPLSTIATRLCPFREIYKFTVVLIHPSIFAQDPLRDISGVFVGLGKTVIIMEIDSTFTDSLVASISSFHDICQDMHQEESPDECSVERSMSGYLLGAMTGKGGSVNIHESLFPRMLSFGFHNIHRRNIQKIHVIKNLTIYEEVQMQYFFLKTVKIRGGVQVTERLEEGAVAKAEIQGAEKAEIQAAKKTRLQVEEKAGSQAAENVENQAVEKTRIQVAEKAGTEAVEKGGTTVAGKTGIQGADKTEIQAAEKEGTQAAEKGGIQAAEKGGIQATEKGGIQVAEKEGTQAAEKGGIQATEKGGIQATEKGGIQVAEKGGIQATEKGEIQAVEKGGIHATEKGGIQAVEKGGIQVTEKGEIQATEKGGIQAAETGGIQSAEKGGIQATENGAIQAAEKGGIQPAEKGGIQPAEKGGIPAAEKGGILAAEKLATKDATIIKKLQVVASVDDFSSDLLTELKAVKADLERYQDFSDWLHKLQMFAEKIKNAPGDQENTDEAMCILRLQLPNFVKAVENKGLQSVLRSGVGRLYNAIKIKIKEKIKNKKDFPYYQLVIVSHGRISLCHDEILRTTLGTLTDIVFYSPWGCTVDALVVHGIATGTIEPRHRMFNGTSNAASVPLTFNRLSTRPNGPIPLVDLSPLKPDDGGKVLLNRWKTLVKDTEGVLVIPIEQHEYPDVPSIPLWLMAGICAVVGLTLEKTFTYHHAACLSRSPHYAELVKGFDAQYCHTTDNYQDVLMSAPDIPGIDDRAFFAQFQATLDPLL